MNTPEIHEKYYAQYKAVEILPEYYYLLGCQVEKFHE